MILAINTAQSLHELALIDAADDNTAGKLLTERIWSDERNDLERLVPTLQEMLDELGLEKSEITQIVLCVGPGHYTAVRTGVAFANALAEALGARLYEITTFELLHKKIATSDSSIAITGAGGMDIGMSLVDSQDGVKDAVKVGPISNLLAPLKPGSTKVAAELNEALSEELHSICLEKGWEKVKGEKLQSMGEVLLTFGLGNLKTSDNAQVYYLKEPKVTQSEDPWKNPKLKKSKT